MVRVVVGRFFAFKRRMCLLDSELFAGVDLVSSIRLGYARWPSGLIVVRHAAYGTPLES